MFLLKPKHCSIYIPTAESIFPFREKGCNVRRQHCPIHLLKVNVILALCASGKSQGTMFKLRNPY